MVASGMQILHKRMKGIEMAITPQEIEQLTFSPSKNGYDTEEVDQFLDRLSEELDAMLQKIVDLKSRLNTAESSLAASQAQVVELQHQLENTNAAASNVAPAPQTTPVSDALAASESQISKVLIVAQQSADKLVSDARENAESIRNEADQKAREVIRQALAEKQQELDEIDRLKQSREEFRGEYKKLLQHFMDDADSVFPASSANNSGTSSSTSAPAAMPAPAPAPVTTAPVAPVQDAGATILTRSIGSAQPMTSPDDFGDLD